MPDAASTRLGPHQRLRHRADFLAAAAGKRWAGSGFVLQGRKRGDTGPARVGFTVSKKVGTAVERNRVRRRLKEVVNRFAGNRMLPGHDYILVGRRDALTLPFGRLGEDLERAFDRLREQDTVRGRSGHGHPGPRPGQRTGDKRVQ